MSCPQLLTVFKRCGSHDTIQDPLSLHLKVVLLGCAAVQLLTLCSRWAVKIYAYRKKVQTVTQQALLGAGDGEDDAPCSQLHATEGLDQQPVCQD